MSATPTDEGSLVAGTRVTVSSPPRTTATPSAFTLWMSACATSTSTASWPAPLKRAPKMLPIAPAPTTAILMAPTSLACDRTTLFVRGEPAAAGQEAAVGDERLTGDEGARVRGEELAQADQLGGPARPLHRHAVHDPAPHVGVGPDRRGERRVHVAGRDRIRSDPVRRPLERHHARELREPRFRRPVDGDLLEAVREVERADVDDRAAAGLDHDSRRRLRQEVRQPQGDARG